MDLFGKGLTISVAKDTNMSRNVLNEVSRFQSKQKLSLQFCYNNIFTFIGTQSCARSVLEITRHSVVRAWRRCDVTGVYVRFDSRTYVFVILYAESNHAQYRKC